MTVIRDTKGKRLCELSAFYLPLQKGTRFVLDPKILNRDHETQYQLIDWQYRITNKAATPDTVSDLELVVKEIRPGYFESRFQRLSNDTQFWAPTTAAVLTLLVGLAVALDALRSTDSRPRLRRKTHPRLRSRSNYPFSRLPASMEAWPLQPTIQLQKIFLPRSPPSPADGSSAPCGCSFQTFPQTSTAPTPNTSPTPKHSDNP